MNEPPSGGRKSDTPPGWLDDGRPSRDVAHDARVADDRDLPVAEPSESSPYIRLPWPVVGGALALLLVLLFAGGLYANRNLRQSLAPATVAGVDATSPPSTSPPTTAAAAAASPVALTPAPPTLALPTSVPAVAVTPASTSLVIVLPAATPRPAPSPSATPTILPELALELDSAYQRYWDVVAQALFDLDSTHLSEVSSDEQLAAIETLIGELRGEGHAIRTEVDHKYAIVRASSDEASIVDKYTDTSVYVDLATRMQIGEPVNDTIQDQYRLRRIDGTWRVVSLVRTP